MEVFLFNILSRSDDFSFNFRSEKRDKGRSPRFNDAMKGHEWIYPRRDGKTGFKVILRGSRSST